MGRKKAMTAQHILDALRKRHTENDEVAAPWVYAEEVRISTGYSSWPMTFYTGGTHPPELMGAAEQRIDAFALHAWPSKRGLRIAYEVKVTMSDLRHELADPGKCAAAMFLSNQFYLAIPHSMKAKLPELPDEWGVMTVAANGNVRISRDAPWRDAPLPPYTFMLSLARNLQRRREVPDGT